MTAPTVLRLFERFRQDRVRSRIHGADAPLCDAL
jgi:hypothetical protein